MPVFTLQGPDGRTIDIEAADQATAMRGAQEWAAANPAPAKATAKSASLFDQVGSAVGSAVDKLKSDVTAGVNRRPSPSLSGSIADTIPSLGRTATLVGDVVGIPGAAVGAVQNALVSRPYGRAMSAVTGGGYPEDRATADMNTALMAAMPGKAGLAAAAPKVSALADNVAAFDRAGVRPTLAAVKPGLAPLAKAAAETPIVGARTRNALAASIDDTAGAAQAAAAKFGTAAPRGSAGETVQEGIRQYAKGEGSTLPADIARQQPSRRVTFGDKANALYTSAERLVGNTDAPVALPSTMQALGDVLYHYKTRSLADEYTNPDVVRLASILSNEGGSLPWSDAAKLRTTIRTTLKADPVLRAKISDAQIDGIYSALTKDLADGAAQLGGPEAGRAWQRANQFYRAGNARIDHALKGFTGKESAPMAGEATYDRIIRAAGDKGGADTGRLAALKKSLNPDDWGTVAATAIDRMGQPTPGTADLGGFSVSRFTTNYASLSPHGKSLLFGNGPLRAELENLNRVAGLQKGVERAANTSNTATVGRATAIGATITQPHLWLPASQALAGLALTGEAMSNPVVVRWLARSAKAAQQGPPQLTAVNRQLRIAAASNAALQPLLHQTTRLLEAPRVATPSAATSQSEQDQQNTAAPVN